MGTSLLNIEVSATYSFILENIWEQTVKANLNWAIREHQGLHVEQVRTVY